MASIVVYDSGVGGLSIYQEVRQRCPHHHYIFVSDNQAFPYGTKTETELISRVLAVSEKIAAEYKPDILIVACNTASTVVLPLLRERFKFRVVGVVPAIKPAAKLSSSKVIGLLATPATIERSYTKELIAEFASDCQLVSVGSSELVQLAEDKLYGKRLELGDITTILKPILDAEWLDTLVLACTHFPLLRDEMAGVIAAAGKRITIIDSGAAIAKRVAQLLLDKKDESGSSIAAFTAVQDDVKMLEGLDKLGFKEVMVLSIN